MSKVEPYRPFMIIDHRKDSTIFRVNKYGELEVLIRGARFTTVPDNKWNTRVSKRFEKGTIQYYEEPFEQPEAFTEKERYRYAQSQSTKQERQIDG